MAKAYMSVKFLENSISKFTVVCKDENDKQRIQTPVKLVFYRRTSAASFEVVDSVSNSFSKTKISPLALEQPVQIGDISTCEKIFYDINRKVLYIPVEVAGMTKPEYRYVKPEPSETYTYIHDGRVDYDFDKTGAFVSYQYENLNIHIDKFTGYPDKTPYNNALKAVNIYMSIYFGIKVQSVKTVQQAKKLAKEYSDAVICYGTEKERLLNYTLEDFYKESGINCHSDC